MKRTYLGFELDNFINVQEKSLILKNATIIDLNPIKLHKNWIAHAIDSIHFGDCRISGSLHDFATSIASHQNLKEFSMNDVKMSDEDLAIIINSLIKNKVQIKSISLISFNIGPRSIKALARLLKSNDSIETITLSKNLATGLKREEAIQSGKNLREEDIKILAAALTNSSIKTVIFDRNTISSEGMRALAKAFESSTIQTIQFTNNDVMDENCLKFLADALKTHPTIKTLNLEGNMITDQGAKIIAEIIRHNPALEVLNLNNNEIQQAGFDALTNAIKLNDQLKSISLQKNKKINDFSPLAAALRVNQTIETIDLGYNKIKSQVAPITDIINHHHNLKNLSLVACKIDNVGIQKIAQPLKANESQLKNLDVQCNKIKAPGVKFFASSHIEIEPKISYSKTEKILALQKKHG